MKLQAVHSEQKSLSKIDAFFAQYPQRTFSKGQILIYAGDNPSGIFHIDEGNVRQYDITKSGDEVVVNVFKPPAFFPVSWVINKTKNEYFFEAFTDIKVRKAPIDKTLEFLENNHDVTFDLLSRVYSGVNRMQRRMTHTMGNNTHNRVVIELILECERFGKKQPDGSYLLEMHESEIAARAGLSRETVSRHVTKSGLSKIIKISHQNIIIKDLEALRQKLEE